ncbi:MAG TPA: lamin tail domain-containing protein [Candidatus Saccharimonadales bacterium]|nr:lamin tail domain-containing protein [Candidatus Saccharimonadales bacterium]
MLLLSFVPLQANAGQPATSPVADMEVDAPEVIITEFQTNGGAAAQEFIELRNTTDQDIVLGDGSTTGPHWKLQFYGTALFAKDGQPLWTAKPANNLVLKGTIRAHDYFLVSTAGYTPAESAGGNKQHYGTATTNYLTDAGGGLRLVLMASGQNVLPIVHDRLAWMDPDKKPAQGVLATPAKGLSQQRHPFEDDSYVSAGVELADFGGESDVTPGMPWAPPAISEDPVAAQPDTAGRSEEPDPVGTDPLQPAQPANDNGRAPYLTELLPNPAAPAKDETDEYIEVYNPGAEPFNLKGYTLQAGLTTLREFTFANDTLVLPESYRTFRTLETRLSLANAGSQVRLLDPQGIVVSETAAYTDAAEGKAWALSNTTWQWSTTASPGLGNVVTSAATVAALAKTSTAQKPAAKAAAKNTAKTGTAKASTTKTGTTKAKAAAKMKVAKAKSAKKTKTKKAAKPKVTAVAHTATKPPRSPIHGGILVTVVALAVLYAAYEYRHDISNRFYKLRRHRTVRAYAR